MTCELCGSANVTVVIRQPRFTLYLCHACAGKPDATVLSVLEAIHGVDQARYLLATDIETQQA